MTSLLKNHRASRVFLLLAIAFVWAAVGSAKAQQAPVQTAETQAALTPDRALELLKAGNERFVSGNMMQRDYMNQVEQTATGQYPFAVVLSCIDSRVPPELVFDQGVGDIFTARVAGNFVNTDILGSMEFATAVAGSKLIVVLGHTECGAVKGACDRVEMGNLTHTLGNLAPALYAVETEGERSSQNKDFVHAVTEENVRLNVQNILERSQVIRDQVENGEVKVIGALHDVSTGTVTFYDEPDLGQGP
jgi:carbonic anhydrase